MKILKPRKGQGLSLNAVIIAILVMVVLVVLVMIFTGQMGGFLEGIFGTTKESCLGSGGRLCGSCSGYEMPDQSNYKDLNGKTCCKMTYLGECT